MRTTEGQLRTARCAIVRMRLEAKGDEIAVLDTAYAAIEQALTREIDASNRCSRGCFAPGDYCTRCGKAAGRREP